jgi:hypothetical protein
MACSQVHLQSCGGGRWVRMQRTALTTNGAIWGTHWMPTRLKDRREPWRLHGRWIHGVACATACPTAVHRTRATPISRVKGQGSGGHRGGTAV